jgi:hypothetical protein
MEIRSVRSLCYKIVWESLTICLQYWHKIYNILSDSQMSFAYIYIPCLSLVVVIVFLCKLKIKINWLLLYDIFVHTFISIDDFVLFASIVCTTLLSETILIQDFLIYYNVKATCRAYAHYWPMTTDHKRRGT